MLSPTAINDGVPRTFMMEEEDEPFSDEFLASVAASHEESEEEYVEEEEKPFSDEFLASVAASHEESEEEYVEEEPPTADTAESEETVPPHYLFSRPGIRRNLLGYGIFTLWGAFPCVLLLFLSNGLGSEMTLFTVLITLGWVLSLYNVYYLFCHSLEFSVGFNHRSFLRFWPEVVVISAVLMAISLSNLNQLAHNSHFLSLTAQPIIPQNQMVPTAIVATGNSLVDDHFFGSVLGYTYIFGIAGAIFAIFRRFETPFSPKYIEIIDIRTIEVTVDHLPIAPVMKPVNVVVRLLMGLFFGANMGFCLGILLVMSVVVILGHDLSSPQVATLLSPLGINKNPDLAFVHSLILGGLFIPLVVVVLKMSPFGMAVSDELIRAHYEIKPLAQPPEANDQNGLG